MQFQVPQFIEVEDKIFGPLTFKQFIYVVGGAGLGYIMWRVFPFYIGAPLAAGAAGSGAALAFLKYNGQPLILGVENAFYYLVRGKLYLWSSKTTSKPVMPTVAPQQKTGMPLQQIYVPKLSESKLHELAWSLDIKERISAGTASDKDRTLVSPLQNVVAPVVTARSALIK